MSQNTRGSGVLVCSLSALHTGKSECSVADSHLIHMQVPPGYSSESNSPQSGQVTKQLISHCRKQGEKVLILKTKENQKALQSRANNTTCSSLSKLTFNLVYLYQMHNLMETELESLLQLYKLTSSNVFN